MKGWHWFLIGVFVASIASFFICQYIHHTVASQPLKNDSLATALRVNDSLVIEIDEIKHNLYIRGSKSDTSTKIQNEIINLVYQNNDVDSLQHEQLRTINRLKKRKCPY